jgi:hypothetical protein
MKTGRLVITGRRRTIIYPAGDGAGRADSS